MLDRIIHVMNQKNVKPKEVTEYLGLNQQQFTNWKNGSSKSYLKYISKIATFLDVPVSYLYGVDEPEPTVSFELSDSEKQLLVIFHHLSEDKQKQVMNYVVNLSLEELE